MKEQQGLPTSGQQLHHFSNYDLIRRIDVGGMGEVYLAYQRTAFNRKVAVKIIRSDLVHDTTARKRFLREAEVSAHLKHDHILPMFEFGEEQGRLFIVTPYIEGGTLARRLQSGPLSLLETRQLFTALVQAVSYIHKRGVIHRDLKPSNILLDRGDDDSQVYVRLIDFGIASLQGNAVSPQMTIGGQEMGTLAYLAPERLNGIAAPSNDIYSLGVILYQMLTGELPVISSGLVLPPALDTVIQRSTATNPAERYATADELLRAFEGTYRYLSSIRSVDRPVTDHTPSVEIDNVPTPGRIVHTPPAVDLDASAGAIAEQTTGAQTPVSARQVTGSQTRVPARQVTGSQPSVSARQVAGTPPQTRSVPGRQTTGSRPAVPPRQASGPQPAINNTVSKTNSAEMPALPLRQPTTPRATSARASSAELVAIQPEQQGLKRAGMLVHTQDQVAFTRQDYDAPTSYLTPAAQDARRTKAPAPSQPVKKPVLSPARRRSLLALLPVSVLLILLVVGGLSYLTYQASIVATVSVMPKVQGISQTFTLKAMPNPDNPGDDTVIQAKAATDTQKSTLQGATSGKTGCTLFGIFDCKKSVAPYDVTFLASELRPNLQRQISQDIQKNALQNAQQLVGTIVYNDNTITSTPDIGTESKTVQVTLSEQGVIEYFSKNDARQQASKLLQKLMAQKFGSSYHLLDTYTQISEASVQGVDANGVITIQIAVGGIASYQMPDSEISTMQSHLKGMTQKAALAYLVKQTGIDPASVNVRISAGTTIPTNEQQIKIVPAAPNVESLLPVKLPKLPPGIIFTP